VNVPTPRARFEALVADPEADAPVAEMRRGIVQATLSALEQSQAVDEEGLAQIMPALYEEIVLSRVQLAGHLGVGVALAISAYDELVHGASIGRFVRPARDLMTEMGVALKKRHSSRLAHQIAEIEAQRLALRHGHEFLSWLAFRREDEAHPPADRLERLHAFKVPDRILKSRMVLHGLVGAPLAAAVEANDRFLLANRWLPTPTPEQAVERVVWPILSYQTEDAVRAEQARFEYDAKVHAQAPDPELAPLRRTIADAFAAQLAAALDHLPPSATLAF